MTSATNYLPKPSCSLSSLSWILTPPLKNENNAGRKCNYLIFKGVFLEEIILRRLPNENIIRQFGEVSGVGKSTVFKKQPHLLLLHTAWSLEFAEPQVTVALAMHMGVMTQTNFPCLQSL